MRVSIGNLGLRENLFVYFNIVCSQSKSEISLLLLLLLLSKEPIARKSFDSPRFKINKLDNFQQHAVLIQFSILCLTVLVIDAVNGWAQLLKQDLNKRHAI